MFSPLMLSRCPASQKSFTWTDKGTLRTIPVYLAKKKAPIRALGRILQLTQWWKLYRRVLPTRRVKTGMCHTLTLTVSNWLAAG